MLGDDVALEREAAVRIELDDLIGVGERVIVVTVVVVGQPAVEKGGCKSRRKPDGIRTCAENLKARRRSQAARRS